MPGWDFKSEIMARLEQLSELLITEINQFEKTVDKLEKFSSRKSVLILQLLK